MNIFLVLKRPAIPLAVLLAMASLDSHAVAGTGETPLPADLASWSTVGQSGSSVLDGDIGLSPFGSLKYGYVTTSDSSAFHVSPVSLQSGGNRGSGVEENGSKITSGSFSALAGAALRIQFNYVSTDRKGYDDCAWARLLDADTSATVSWLFTATSSHTNNKGIVPGDVVDKKLFDPEDVITNYDAFEFTSKTALDPVNWSPLGVSNRSCWEDNAAGCGFTGWLESRTTFANSGNYRVEIGVVNRGDTANDTGLAFDFQGLTDSRIAVAVPEPGSYAMLLGSWA